MKKFLLLLYAKWFPIYWKQDNSNVNGGKEILSIKKTKGYYFYGTARERWEVFNKEFKIN